MVPVPILTRVQESRHGVGFALPAHRHVCMSLLVAVGGAGKCRVGRQRFEIAAHDAVLIPAHAEHEVADAPGRPLTLFAIYLEGPCARRCEDLLGAEARRVRVSPQDAVGMRRLLRRALHEQSHDLPGCELLVEAAIIELLVTLARSRPSAVSSARPAASTRVREVAACVRARYYEDWSLPQVAAMAGLSVRAFSESFRAAQGQSFVQFLNAVRVEQACRMLRESDAKVSTVCFEAGFEDLSHFYRIFRRQMGYPPGEARRSDGVRACESAPSAQRRARGGSRRS